MPEPNSFNYANIVEIKVFGGGLISKCKVAESLNENAEIVGSTALFSHSNCEVSRQKKSEEKLGD